MAVHIVRLGTARLRAEGPRLGTVRRPPRGVPKTAYARENWYDAWLPELAPSVAAVKMARAARTPRAWAAFARRYRREMAAPERARLLDVLAVLSRGTNFSVGCYCADESRCHRSVLRELLREHGARLV